METKAVNGPRNVEKRHGRKSDDFQNGDETSTMISTENGKNPPMVVPDGEMRNFMLATSTESEHVRLVKPGQCHFKSGDPVRVIGGPFCGVEGRVARLAGQQRVIVAISGLCSIATAYIPSAFIETIE